MSTPTDLEQLRMKKREIEQYLPEIEQKKEICNQLTENIVYEKQKLQSIKKEILFRSNRLSELHAQYRAITEKGAVGSKKQIEDIKTQIIKEKLEELLSQKIPEVNIQTNKINKNSLKENEFQNLIHSNIKIVYSKYESPESKIKKEVIQFFRISSHTKFSTLKEAACHYWRIEDPVEFVFTDDAEAIIYNEEYLINDYMKHYSVRSNMIRLISSSLLKARPKLIPLQEDRLKEENSFKVKSRFEVKQRESGSNTQKVNEFAYLYSGLTPYYLSKDEHMNIEPTLNKRNSEAKEIETSLIMLVLTILLFVLTIVIIYSPSKDIWLNYSKKVYIKQLLENTNPITEAEGDVVLGPLHSILSRVTNTDCSKDEIIKNMNPTNCTEKEYSKSTKSTTLNKTLIPDNDGSIFNKFENYQSSNEANVHISVSSESGYFNGDGFHANHNFEYIKTLLSCIPKTYSEVDTSSCKQKLYQYFLKDPNIRGLTFLLNLNFSNEEIYGNIMVHINFLATGGISLNEIEVRFFTPSIYKDGYLVIDIIRLIIIIIMILLIILDISLSKKSFKTLLTSNFFLYIFILGWFLACFIIKLVYCVKSTSDFAQGSTQYADGYELAIMTENAVYLECVLLIFITIRLLMFFKLAKAMKLLFTVMNLSFSMFIQYLIPMIAMFFGFAVVAEIIWSPYLDNYKTFGSSFLSVLLFTCGYFDTYSLMHYNLIWAFFFITFFFLFNLFFLFAIFNSIFAESLRRTVTTSGYPNDRKKSLWSMRDYMIWIVHFVKEEKIEKAD